MKTLSIVLLVFSVVACGSIPFLGGAKNSIESIVAVGAAGIYTVQIIKNGEVVASETWECTQADGKLTGCHKR